LMRLRKSRSSKTSEMKSDREPDIVAFSSAEKWSVWLSRHQGRQGGVWLRLFRKNSGRKTVSHAEALDEALCHGWIDGQGKSHDEISWILKFTPRRPRSVWSKRNRENVERLIGQKRMKAAGLKEVSAAKSDGRWDAAYDPAASMKVPPDFLRELKKDKDAYTFYKTLNRANTYAIAWRLQTARKPETRAKRLNVLLEMMKKRRKLH
jgi:uncharacterized protein YdeI (YjbR/CyaY-like superfamily)